MTNPRTALVVLVLGAIPAFAESSSTEAARYAQKVHNPIADLTRLNFVANVNQRVVDTKEAQTVFDMEWVRPFVYRETWDVITRTTLPIISQPEVLAGPSNGRDGGLGDLTFTAYFTRPRSEGMQWGIGPTVTLPTATESSMGADQFSVGPAAVVLTRRNQWLYGVQASDIFDLFGKSDAADVHKMVVQPFVFYELQDGWYLQSSPKIVFDWEGNDGDKWILPVGVGVGRIFTVMEQPMHASLHYSRTIETTTAGPESILRLQFELLFKGRR